MKIIIKAVILICCIFGMCYFSYNIIDYLLDESNNNNLNNNLINSAVIQSDSHVDKNLEDNIEENQLENIDEGTDTMKIDFEVLKQINSDIVGWIYLENTPINYPIVQSKDNDYYLRRLVDGTYNRAGTLFMDYRNDNNMNDWNTIIYGHNMKNNTMFGPIIGYKNQSYYDEHKKIYYFTESQNYVIEPFAGYIEDANSEIYNLSITNEKEQIIKKAILQSTFKSDVEINADDKFVTLSTCSYEYEDARYVLMGKITKE